MPENPAKRETTQYAVEWKLAEDICKAIGLDASRVSRLKFEAKAEDMGKPLTLEVDYLPDYEGLPESRYEATEIKSDPLEDSYRESDV